VGKFKDPGVSPKHEGRTLFDDYPCISEVMKRPKKSPGPLHPLVKAIDNPRYDLVNLQEVEAKLARLKASDLLTDRLKGHLTNPKQFLPSMAEVDVVLRLMDYGLEAHWGTDPPDIEIRNLQMDIEVKRMSVADRLKNARNGQVVVLDDIQRMRTRIRHEVLPSIRDDHAYILVFTAEGFGLDEFGDLLLDRGSIADPESEGLFRRPECCRISAAVLMREPFLWPSRRRVRLDSRSPVFAGILNPRSKKEVPVALRKAFNIVSPEDFSNDL